MKTRTKVGVAAAAAALALGVGVGPAAATQESGHIQTVDISGGCDWPMYLTWDTSYNSVGTSSTQPLYMDTRQAAGCLLPFKQAKSIKLVFKTAAGSVRGTLLQNTSTPGVNDTAAGYWDDTLLNTAAYPNILLSDGPRATITFYTATNQGGSVLKTITYAYK